MIFDITNTTAYKIRPTISSNDTAWINWHKALKSDIGSSLAAVIFIKVWDKQGTSNANTTALRKYLSDNGISIDENFFNKIADIGSGIGDTFSNIFKFGEYTALAVTGIVIMGLAMVVYNVAKSPEKYIPKGN